MVQIEAILQTSATMIVGILFVVTLAETLHLKHVVGRIAFVFFLCGVLPFSVSAICALFDSLELAKTFCISGFVYFAVLLLALAYRSSQEEEEEKKQIKLQT